MTLMSQKNQSTALLVGIFGCGFLLLLVVGGAFVFLSRSSTPVSGGTPGAPSKIEAGYSIVPGALSAVEGGAWEATLRFEVTDGWNVDELTFSKEQLRVGGDQQAIKSTSPIPSTPIGEGFDLVYRFELPPAVEGEPVVPVLWFEVETRASESGLFGSKTQSSRSTSFVIDEESGTLRAR